MVEPHFEKVFVRNSQYVSQHEIICMGLSPSCAISSLTISSIRRAYLHVQSSCSDFCMDVTDFQALLHNINV